MDDFVHAKLTEWKLVDYIEIFKDEGIDKESLFCLEDKDIDDLIRKRGPRARFKSRLAELKARQTCGPEAEPEQVFPSTSTAHEKGQISKRKSDPEPATPQKKPKRQSDTAKDEMILRKVKGIMKDIRHTMSHETHDSKLNAFLRKKNLDLRTDKKELVGVFGKTGAGKSSLINAVVQEKGLLPTGSLTACTTAMIKVEENTQPKYEAEVEFISNEDWRDEVWSVKNLCGNEEMEDNSDDILREEMDENEENKDNIEKMNALYGEEWKVKTLENLMESKYFKEIPEFLRNERKIIKAESAKELSTKVLKYTRTTSNEGNDDRCFWPLVKCVTIRVPDNDFLKHVTLVDLPGNGDRNKSRDQMWKKVVSDCSTVWIVSEMKRAVADRDAWDILENTCGLMGNGGECQKIYFICTMSDNLVEGGCTSTLEKNNTKVKDLVKKEFSKLRRVKAQFKDDSFDVFTVSSKDYLKLKNSERRDLTEIPKLQDLLKRLNDQYDLTLHYVSGAYGILSLIQGAKQMNEESDQNAIVHEKLRMKMEEELNKVSKSMEDVWTVFDERLSAGVKESKMLCEEELRKSLHPRGGGSGFHRPLNCALRKRGIHKSEMQQINLNNAISRFMTDSIDEEFIKSFPNDAKSGPLYGTIHKFSLNTKELVQQHKHFELLLTFLETEETKIKTRVCREIRDRKKEIYNSLNEIVAETMQKGYSVAACKTGPGCLEAMRETVQGHLTKVKDTVFEEAKAVVLDKLKELKRQVLKDLRDTLSESMDRSFKGSDYKSIPDFSSEFDLVKKHYDMLLSPKQEGLSGPDLLD